MSRTIRHTTEADVLAVRDATSMLRETYRLLVKARVPRAAGKVYQALRSAEEATRHVRRRAMVAGLLAALLAGAMTAACGQGDRLTGPARLARVEPPPTRAQQCVDRIGGRSSCVPVSPQKGATHDTR